MARTSEDILFRRTKLGINFPKEARDKLEIILKDTFSSYDIINLCKNLFYQLIKEQLQHVQ